MDTALVGSSITQISPNSAAVAQTAGMVQNNEDVHLLEKCREFESLLYAEMLRAMRKTVEKSPLFYGGRAEDIYTSLLDDEYAKVMAGSMQRGIAEALYQQLKRPHATSPGDIEEGRKDHGKTDRAALIRKGG